MVVFRNCLRLGDRQAWSGMLAALAWFACAASVAAQQRPTLGYVYPAGCQPGQSVEVDLGGYDLTPDTSIWVHDQRVSLEILSQPGPLLFSGPPYWFGPRALNSYKPFPIPREIKTKITIPASAEPGIVTWQVTNANGGSDLIDFVIADAVPEILEESLEIENDKKQLPSLPLTLNGRLEKKEEVDLFEFRVPQDGLVTLELSTANIGFPLNAEIQVWDESKQLIAEYADTASSGAALTFSAMAANRYTLQLNDLDYRGNRAMVYRMSLRPGPRVVAMLPTQVAADTDTNVTFIGYGVETGQPKLEQTTRTITSGSKSFRYTLKTDFGLCAPLDIPVGETADVIVDSSQTAGPLKLPIHLCSVFSDSRPYHSYEFDAVKGDNFAVHLASPEFGAELDLAYVVIDPEGKTIAKNDDLTGSLDAGGTLKIPADGRYRLIIMNQTSPQGRLDFVYRLSIETPRPDFDLTVPQRIETIIGAEPITPAKKRRAGKQQPGAIGIDLARIGGFAGEVTIDLEMPESMGGKQQFKLDPSQSGLDLPIPCGADVTPDAFRVSLRATATLEEGSEKTISESVLVCPILSPLAVVRPKYPDAARTVNRGAVYPAPVVVERLDSYQGPVELQMAAVPDRVRQGILGDSSTIPAGQTEGVFPLVIPEWVQTDRTSRIILNSVVTIPDASGKPRTLVNRMERRITMNVEGALLKINVDEPVIASGEDSVLIPFELYRSGELAGPVEVTAFDLATGEVVGGPQTLSAEIRSGQLTVNRSLLFANPCSLRATAEHEGYPVTSEVKVDLQ